MAENLKEVIARLKAQQNSQVSKPVESPKPLQQAIKEEIDDEMDDIDEEIGIPQEMPKLPELNKEEINAQQKALMEIEILQNNGRFRLELLHQMQEINNALVVIASALTDLNGKR